MTNDAILDFYKENSPEFVITKRIQEGIGNLISKHESKGEEYIHNILANEKMKNYIRQRQPLSGEIPDIVVSHVEEYFSKHLPEYKGVEIYRKSNHPDDSYLYEVVAKRSDNSSFFGEGSEYVCFTSWNEKTQSLNHGHYNVDYEKAIAIAKENYNDISGNDERFSIENSKKPFSENVMQQQESVRRRVSR